MEMNWIDNTIIAAATIVTGALSWAAARYAQKVQSKHRVVDLAIERNRQDDEHTQTLLEGYSNMVDDLREEVKRLNVTITELRREQEECEKRNDALASVVLDLQRRLVNLEVERSNE
jgi:predicted RNase H-like nuclease (RuvC/YqgF family)